MQTYTLSGPVDASRDYLATGDLGPINFVSGGRIRRDLFLGGYYAGSLYVESQAWIGLEASQIKRRDSVWFSVAPYERNHKNRDYIAAGESGGCTLFPYRSLFFTRKAAELAAIDKSSRKLPCY